MERVDRIGRVESGAAPGRPSNRKRLVGVNMKVVKVATGARKGKQLWRNESDFIVVDGRFDIAVCSNVGESRE